MGSTITNPVINGPYDEPRQHFRFDDNGITDEIADGRRRSEYFVPVPQTKKRGAQLQFDNEWTLNRLQPNDFINDVRSRVDLWRKRGFEHVTPTTRRLLEYWSDESRENRVLFAQREAAETAIYLTEAAAKDNQGWMLARLDETNETFNGGLPRVALKMATGSGKTVVMTMLIAWQVLNKSASANDKRFTRRRKSGVQNGRRAERFEFDEIERLPGRYLTARAVPSGNVAGSVGGRQHRSALRHRRRRLDQGVRARGDARPRARRPARAGFAFDPRALEVVEEFKPEQGEGFAVQAEHDAGGIRILLVRMNADLAMGEKLLKKTKAANLFTVFGEPDVSEPQWTDGGWVVTIHGFDVYNPVTGEVRPGGQDDIAMWMIDTDYNEESFFARHAYFLGAKPYERLKKALKAEIDPEAWETLNSATSRPFAHPPTGKIAIKVVNHYGDEPLTVLDLPSPPQN